MPPRKNPAPPPIEIRTFTPDEIERGITKLKRRMDEVRAFSPAKAAERGDQSALVLARDIRDSIRDVFGQNSPEFQDNETISLWAGPTCMDMEQSDKMEAYSGGQTAALQLLEGLIKRLEEKRSEHRQGEVR